MNRYETIVHYHEVTKHHFNRYARSSGYMDWHNQPNPFRNYEGAEQIALPFCDPDPGLAYGGLYSSAEGKAEPLTLSSVGGFCELALGLSAWKQAGPSRWSLRMNPSSGNLHPTESYLLLPDMKRLPGGLFHYSPFAHSLECRIQVPEKAATRFQAHFNPGFGVALTAIFWRESWKYGERAYRYSNLDAGHALAALAFAARLFGWTCWAITGAGDDQIDTMLGLDRTKQPHLEQETSELFCWITTRSLAHPVPLDLPDGLVKSLSALPLNGYPNRLSPKAVDWAIIDAAAQATRKPATTATAIELSQEPAVVGQPMNKKASEVIRCRRSAVRYNPHKAISKQSLLAMIDATRARAGIPPFSTAFISPAIHLLLFVHRVNDVPPGLYLLARGGEAVAPLIDQWHPDLLWQQVEGNMPLFKLLETDMTFAAMELSCHQQIAGQSAYAAAMLAPFETCLQQAPHLYRYLHWECGMIGQVLYLGAEAHGLRATGIGCFFDDEVHRLLGIKDRSYQSLYHFTVGHPVEDERLMTLPAYHHVTRE